MLYETRQRTPLFNAPLPAPQPPHAPPVVQARRVVPAPPVVHLPAPPAPAVDVIVSMEERMARLETMFLAKNQMYDHQYVYALNVANHEVRHVPCGCEACN